ncbi:MAG: CaiB/BaiF CoA transferase family protein [Acidimicrobiales bacterium]
MDRVLEGVRVFEMGIAIAAPNAGRMLAHHGAEVYKVESPTAPDVVRLLGSAWLRDDEEREAAWPDSSPYLAEMNADKRSVALDLKTPTGRQAARDLLAGCDVFLANYGARALAEAGFDYASVRDIRPDIVYVHLPGFGADPTSPYYRFVAWGPNQAPLVGIDALTGHPDREPAGIATIAPPDYFSSLQATLAVIAGLEHRDRTGEGIHVDISQFESTISNLLGPFVLDYELNGRVQTRTGNRSAWYAPEGVYPCQGEERWIAVSVTDDEEWAALAAEAPPDLAADPRFSTNEGRMAAAAELDDAIAAWTAGEDALDLAARLQRVGVAAHLVAANEDLLEDAHVKGSGWYQVRPGRRFVRDVYSGHPIHLSATPGRFERAGPSLGEHTVAALTEVAGYDRARIDQLVADGAAFVETEPELVLDRPYEEWLHVMFPRDAIDSRDR